MKTPGHVVVNTASLQALLPDPSATAVVVGAVLPDVPIFVLYAWGRLVRGMPAERIWRELYPQPAFLALVHGLHSFVVTGAGTAICVVAGQPVGALLFASMFVHALLDIPVHGEDAHRHFWPLSQWRFISPLSYWDPRLHAKQVALVEAVLVVACAAVVVTHQDAPPWLRAAVIATALGYPVHWVVVFLLPRAAPGAPFGHG